MDTDKRFVGHSGQQLALNKQYSASITIQLPTTSANQSNNNVDPNNNSTTISNSNTNSINPSNDNLIRNDPLDHCHHQAATRSLLLAHSTSELESTATTESDDSPTPPPHYYEIPGIVPAYQGRTSGPPPSYDEVVNPDAPPPSYQSLFGQVREARKTSNGLVDLFRQLFLILIGTLGCTMIIGFLLLIPITMILVGIVYVNDCRAENIPTFLVIGGLVWIVKNILNCYNQFKKDSSTANRPPPRRAPISTSARRHNIQVALSNGNNNNDDMTVVSQTPRNTSQLAATPNQSAITTTQTIPTTPTPTTAPITRPPTTINATRIRISSTRDQQQGANRIRGPSLIGITSFKCESMLNYFLIVWFLAGCIVVYRIYEPDYDNPLSASYCNRTVYLYAFWLMTSTFIVMAIVLSCLCCLMASSLMSCNHGR